MKKVSFIILLAASGCLVKAQNSKVSSAAVHLQDFIEHQDTADLIQSKEAIDEASQNEKTKDEPKMYLYRGEIYLMFFQLRLGNLNTKLKSPGKAYAAMDTTSILISANSFIKVLQIAPKDFYADEARQKQNMPTCLLQIGNKAIMENSSMRYGSALALYEKALAMDSILGIKDSTVTENIVGAALAATKAGNTAKALKYNMQLISMKVDGSAPYISISDLYFSQKDSADAIDYIQKGRTAYPDDVSLIIKETNIYLIRNNSDKAEANLLLTISKVEAMPDKDKNKSLLARLYTILGGLYDKKANPKTASGTDAPKPADYEDLYSKAETNYTKALALDDKDFDLLFNTGALYFNRGVALNHEASSLPLNATDKFNKLQEEAKSYFTKAQPYFEKAHAIKPDDKSNTNALMQVYNSTGQEDKAKALTGK